MSQSQPETDLPTKAASLFRNLDVFPKVADEARARSASGGATTLSVALCILVLVVTEARLYSSIRTDQTLEVDVSRGGKIAVDFNITFHHLPCSLMSVDSMDISGEHHMDMQENIHKTRIIAGLPAGDAVPHKLGKYNPFMEDSNDGSLDELRKELQEQQGCRISGSIQSNKIAGNVHFALHAVDYFVLSQLFSSFGVVDPLHTIHSLSFGSTFPGQHNPLDGYTWNSSGPVGVKEYYIKVVPVTYTNVKGVQLSSNQYSVTEHFKHAYDGFPAVFVMYDLSPLRVTIKEIQPTFASFMIQLCAIAGGVYVVSGQLEMYGGLLFSWAKRKFQPSDLTSPLAE